VAKAAGRGYLGVSFAALPATEKVVQTGVVVSKVFAGSAARQAGLKPGEIVTQINGIFVGDPKTAAEVVAELHVPAWFAMRLAVWNSFVQIALSNPLSAAIMLTQILVIRHRQIASEMLNLLRFCWQC
jgi:predicted metalloprotease with PDZ domain